ncbi:hypothetical protein AX17_000052 [Amanita inopinata Kibby_2008]|nr:hypothetical protein AX17_000052 [Amanita inopinata Kibby_2008]
MASGPPFLSLATVPPLDLTMADGTTVLQPKHHEGSYPPSSSSTTTATATTKSHLTTHDKRDTHPLFPPQSLAPATSLRKSVSVDSFAQYGRESPVLSGPRPTRGNTSSALEPPRTLVYGISSSLKKEREQQHQTTRNRRTSGNSIRNGGETSHPHDSDIERSDALGSPVERYRRTSLKPQDHAKPILRGGELPLPSRTPTLSTTSSLSSVVTAFSTNSSTLEDVPRLSSLASSQSLPRRGTVPILPVVGRTRSESLGVYNTNTGKRSTVSTNVQTLDVANVDPTVTLVVVGAQGSGKSAVIRKGLKRFALSESVACRTVSGIPGLSSPTNYIRRMGRVGQLENVVDCPLKVLEVNTSQSGPLGPKSNPIVDTVSRVDGVVICYDTSSPTSISPVEQILLDYSLMRTPILVLACKSDLARLVDSAKAHTLCKQYDVGLIEVNHEAGKERIGLAFDFLLQAVWRDRRDKRQNADVKYRNPASPRLLKHSPLWDASRSTTPTAPSPVITVNAASSDQVIGSSTNGSTSKALGASNSPAVTIILNDPKNPADAQTVVWKRGHGLPLLRPQLSVKSGGMDQVPHSTKGGTSVQEVTAEKTEPKEKDLKPTLYMTIDELLDKVLFLAVSADDPSFITHFLLTYRRFITPRSVLLAMQKRMRQLDNPSGDPMFACFAQMRICNLLETWIKDYPHDFAVRGTAGALSALIKSILSKTYLLHYGSELLPFLETLPSLRDTDVAWAVKTEDIGGDSDSESLVDVDEVIKPPEAAPTLNDVQVPPPSLAKSRPAPPRERKASLPLAKALKHVAGSVVNGYNSESAEASAKQRFKELVKLAHEVMLLDAAVVAQEITRLQTNLFLSIQPRHWLHLTFVGKNDFSESITALNSFSNQLAEWVLSLILCHDKPRNRARQIEKFVEIATKLRQLNNYSGLRAFIAGIHGSTFTSDETMETFKTKSPEQYKSLQSWEVLFRPLRSHRAYRMALRNSKGGCIPALEVHIQDLIRAHEGNTDVHTDNPAKIHWGKFNLIGKFIISTTQCQIQCLNAAEYHFPDRGDSIARIFRRPLMSEEMKKLRLPVDDDANEGFFSHRIIPQLALPQPTAPQPTLPQPTAPPAAPPQIAPIRVTPLHVSLPQVALHSSTISQIQYKELYTMRKLLFW